MQGQYTQRSRNGRKSRKFPLQNKSAIQNPRLPLKPTREETVSHQEMNGPQMDFIFSPAVWKV